jgi:enediyne polyketide synthase
MLHIKRPIVGQGCAEVPCPEEACFDYGPMAGHSQQSDSVSPGEGIAIVGMACLYPDAQTPAALWENVLAQRRAFRRLPPERFRLEDYWSPDPSAPDTTYVTEAALIEGYEFDRVAFRVAGSTFRSADLAHWIALDVASRALVDAGFPDGQGLPRETTGVLIGNSLTGEFSRANTLRLRWPYVRRVLDAALGKEGWSAEHRGNFLQALEAEYKSPFPPVGEETLAGGLSNTIAGRICNHFNLQGGGYTVDGACSSSLLAVANACSALTAGDLDLVLAGGVDLSLDPFELIGFAKIGALAADEMRVFDKRSAGMWPGEGCGFVALMRHEDALAQGCRVYAVIRGWGISSDGRGGLTRPEADGQLEALRRAYRRAGFGADTVTYCEGHGTGTTVGDAAELEVLTRVRRDARADAPPAIIGSLKANIGHTKAAAGLAGLLKATMAIHTQVLPPATGCEQPHPLVNGPASALCVLREPEIWPAERPLRASVSAMGFGGINAHVVLEGVVADRRRSLSPRERSLALTQDAELFLLAAPSTEGLLRQGEKLLAIAPRISRAELTDLAAQLAKELGDGIVRAAVVAAKPAELAERLQALCASLQAGATEKLDFHGGVFFAARAAMPRFGFLFPGQGSPTQLDGGLWRRRFESVRALYARAALPASGDAVSTRVMQPAVVTASLAGLAVLGEFGLSAASALGHSLGEITALHWAGAFGESALRGIAQVRGAAMASLGSPTGAMLAIEAPFETVQPLLEHLAVSVVGYNSPRQTVVAGDAHDVAGVLRRAGARGLHATLLPVSHAFHTPLVAAAMPVLAEELAHVSIAGIQRAVFSTISGTLLPADADLRELLCQQVTSPVRFSAALAAMLAVDSRPDLLIEVGPGQVLSGLVRDASEVPVVSLDAGSGSVKGLLQALGAAFALGASIKHARLFADRLVRPFELDWKPKFFVNPCELAPVLSGRISGMVPQGAEKSDASAASPAGVVESLHSAASGEAMPPLELVRQLVAERSELPVATVRDESRMLSDLHLNSITVGQLVSEAAKRLGLARIVGLTDFADASVAEVALVLVELQRTGSTAHQDDQRHQPPGVDVWIQSFAIELQETMLPRPPQAADSAAVPGAWQVLASPEHPLAAPLAGRLAQLPGNGVVLCLPPEPTEEIIPLLLDAARTVMALKHEPSFVLVQHGWGGSGFARTLHQEMHGLATCIVNVPRAHAPAVDWIMAEVAAMSGYCEAHYDATGRRREPRLKLVPLDDAADSAAPAEPVIGLNDVLLVTGGGKGIAAECALAIGRETGVRLALLGRAAPQADAELAANLARIAAAGVRCCYVRADVTDGEAVRQAVAEAEQQLGPITAVLHAAGTNSPQLLGALDADAFRRTVAPKLQGARNVLAAVQPDRLRLFITFGSIIARAGMRGEADYAASNEWTTAFTEAFQAQHPRCRCLALEWSVWSGVGMGERLGRMESLIALGITPIPVDEALRVLRELLGRPQTPVALVVTGRFGEPPTLKLAEPELPLLRFIERKRAYYPAVELIVDAELSAGSDPYLNDHVVQKEQLFPAVLGLEAMAQTAMALTGSSAPPCFERVEFSRPVAIPDQGTTTIRLAALRRGPDLVEVCLRCEATDFCVDHFRTLCRFERSANLSPPQPEEANTKRAAPTPKTGFNPTLLHAPAVALDIGREVYGELLFHTGRFQRLTGYRLLRARECLAEIRTDLSPSWFSRYLPPTLLLGDPGARDAAIHGIQACIPHARLLPIGVDRITLLTAPADAEGTGTVFMHAREVGRDGDLFTYEMQVFDREGQMLERWEGLRLKVVEALRRSTPWPEALLGCYLERRVEELIPGARLDAALLCGTLFRATMHPRTKPTPSSTSIHHSVFCDAQVVTTRSRDSWLRLLGTDGTSLADVITRTSLEDTDTAATRVWIARNVLKQTGGSPDLLLALGPVTKSGWATLTAGAFRIDTSVTTVGETRAKVAIAILME